VGLSRRAKTPVLVSVLVGVAVGAWLLAADARSTGRAGAGGGSRTAAANGPPGRAPMTTTTPSHTPTGSPPPSPTRTPTPTTTAHFHSPTPTSTPLPFISGITPASGPSSGGTAATGAGDFFLPGATATLGGVDASAVVLDAQHIELTSPPLAPATTNALTVTNPGGGSRSWLDLWFSDYLDVPQSSPFHADIEWLFRQRVSGGCGNGNFCPSDTMTRAQMAVLLDKGAHGGHAEYVPPACTATVFEDVPCPGGPYVDWVNDIATLGITAGCGGENFCPLAPVTRAQMAVFLLKGTHVPGYAPPACTWTVFTDVPCPDGPYVDWINELAAEGLTSGCGGGLFCPTAVVSRAQMASFLVRTFWPPLPP